MTVPGRLAVVFAAFTLAACSSTTAGAGNAGTAISDGATATSVRPSTGPTATPVGTEARLGTAAGMSAVVTGAATSGRSASAFCARLDKALSDFGNIDMSNPDPQAMEMGAIAAAAIFAKLRPGAPADVAPAIDDLVSALGKLSAAMGHPGQADDAEIQTLLSDGRDDTTQLIMYSAGNCPRS